MRRHVRPEPNTSLLTAFSLFGVPSSTLRMFFTVAIAMRSIDSTVTPAMCADTMVFGSLISGLSAGVGSLSNTSMPAPASLPLVSAACSAGSSIRPPRAVLTM